MKYFIVSCLILSSCKIISPVKKVTDPIKAASGKVSDTVGAGAITTAVASKNLAQKSAIVTKIPGEVYAREISGENLRKRMAIVEKASWHYMGTRGEFHYIVKEFIDRQIFRVRKKDFPIEDPFKLTALKSKWERLPTRQLRHLPE